jgi:hypothetical protein
MTTSRSLSPVAQASAVPVAVQYKITDVNANVILVTKSATVVPAHQITAADGVSAPQLSPQHMKELMNLLPLLLTGVTP